MSDGDEMFPDEAEAAYHEWLAGRASSAAPPEPLDVDVQRFGDTPAAELADALLQARQVTPTAVHWMLNVAAHRLRASEGTAAPHEPSEDLDLWEQQARNFLVGAAQRAAFAAIARRRAAQRPGALPEIAVIREQLAAKSTEGFLAWLAGYLSGPLPPEPTRGLDQLEIPIYRDGCSCFFCVARRAGGCPECGENGADWSFHALRCKKCGYDDLGTAAPSEPTCDPSDEAVTALATVIWRRDHNGKLPAHQLHGALRWKLEEKARHIFSLVAESRGAPPEGTTDG